GDDLVERANVTVVGGAEYGLGERTEHAAVSCLGLEMQGRPRVRGRKITRKLWLARAYSRARSPCSITVGTTSTMRGGFGHGLGCTSSRSRRIDEGLLRWAGCEVQAKPASTACTLSTLSTTAWAGWPIAARPVTRTSR